MNFEFDKNTPIYLQIEEQIKINIITNKYKPGDKLPSVREFALILKINPNTINRALLELEEQGFIKTYRTSGKYITEEKEIIELEKQKYKKLLLNDFLKQVKKINMTKQEIIDLINRNEEQ